MSLTDELYRETILDHYHQPRNQGELDNASVKVEGNNPLCGDEIVLYLNVDNGIIADVKMTCSGCSISTASASMMTESIKGKDLAYAREVIEHFKKMMMSKDEVVVTPEALEDLEALQGVKKYPVRIKCALLSWNTLLEALNTVTQ
jgi:nitrogen fixation NifU-like protein